MEILKIDVDALITEVLNEMKVTTEAYRSNVLGGMLSQEDYKYQTGYLRGIADAATLLTNVARKTLNGN